MKTIKHILLTSVLSLVFLLNSGVLFAQTENESNDNNSAEQSIIQTDESSPEFKEEDDMKSLKAFRSPLSVSYGAWLTSVFFNDSSSETSASNSIGKAWFKTTLPLNGELYLRITDVYTYYLDSPVDPDPENEFDLDIASLSVANENRSVILLLGRKYFALGTGLVFSGRGDGGEFDLFTTIADIKIFGAYTGLLNEDINTTRLIIGDRFDEGKRIFIGGTLSKNAGNQTMYLLGLYQKDKNDESDTIKTKYDSQYFGAGLKGVLGNAFYYSELVFERGKSYTSNIDPLSLTTVEQKKQDILAAAALFGLNYYFNASIKPAILFNYAFGSGDKDRQQAISATGNSKNTDKGFLYFGNYTGGYALKPYLSNMHVFRLGFSLMPLFNLNQKYLKRINLIVNYSNYLKHRKSSVINYNEANASERMIGHGIDAALKWQIFSDLSVFGNFGMFIPGSAYDEGEETNETRSFTMAGLTLSF